MTNLEVNDKDIAQAWHDLGEKKFSNSIIKKEEIMTAIKMESHSCIAELKKRVKLKLYWSAAISLAFMITSLFFLGNRDMLILLGIAIIAYVIGFIPMYLKYKQIEDGVSGSDDILKSIKHNAALVKSVLKIENIWGIVTFMPAIMIGILGGRLIGGVSLAASFQDPKTLTIILVAVLVITPLLVWATNKMNKVAFGKYLEKLENNIIRMETLK